MGEAVATKRSFVNSIPVIGVNSWGAVYDNEVLIEGEEQVIEEEKKLRNHHYTCFFQISILLDRSNEDRKFTEQLLDIKFTDNLTFNPFENLSY